MGPSHHGGAAAVLNETAIGVASWEGGTPGAHRGRPGRARPAARVHRVAGSAGLRHALACLWAQVTPDGSTRRGLVLPDACADLIWEPGRGAYVAGPDTVRRRP